MGMQIDTESGTTLIFFLFYGVARGGVLSDDKLVRYDHVGFALWYNIILEKG